MAKARRSGGGWGKMLLGFLLGVVAVGAAGFGYLKWKGPGDWREAFTGRKPVWKQPSPPAKRAVRPPVEEHPAGHSAPVLKTPPFGASEDVFEAGAAVYRARCASCHGKPGAAILPKNGTTAAQFWRKGGHGWTAAEIYAATAAGASAKGMPAYRGVLRETELWQVSLLLANAGKPLPDPVTRILSTP